MYEGLLLTGDLNVYITRARIINRPASDQNKAGNVYEIMGQDFKLNVGSYSGRQYFIRGIPKDTNVPPEDFAVVLGYNDSSDHSNEQVARVDTAHGTTHIHKLYRQGQPRVDVAWGYWEAVAELEDRWRTYAESYEQTHG